MESSDRPALSLEARARRAYELGRVRSAAPIAWYVVALTGIGAAVGHRPWLALVTGALLLVVAVGLRWWGRAPGAAVVPGLVAGTLPFLAGLVTTRITHLCTGSACVSLCLPAALLAGLLAGGLVALHAAKQATGTRLVAAGIVASLTGALGCVGLGLGGLAGLGLGLLLGASPALVPIRSRY